MINHHPDEQLLELHAQGLLPASMAAAVAIHADMCSACRQALEKINVYQAESAFEAAPVDVSLSINHLEINGLIDVITGDLSQDVPREPEQITVSVGPVEYQLHRALGGINVEPSTTLGRISRANIALDEGPLHTHLLHVAPGGEVPRHTHKGFEITLMLEGRYVDEMGEYGPGDFIMLDRAHVHAPRSPNGCLCLTVVSDALAFTSGLYQLLNPLGKYLY